MILDPGTVSGAIALAIVFVVGTGRLTRLVVADTFPPIVKVRIWYEDHASGGWETLLRCPWCFGVWATAGNALLGWLLSLAGWYDVWFVGNALLAASYAASYVVYKDED